MNELSFYDGTEDPETAASGGSWVTEAHPYVRGLVAAGSPTRYEHSSRTRLSIWSTTRGGVDPSPSFRDGLQVQRVLAALEASATLTCLRESEKRPREGTGRATPVTLSPTVRRFAVRGVCARVRLGLHA